MRKHYPCLSRGFIDIQIANGHGHIQQLSKAPRAPPPPAIHLSPPQREDSTRVQLQKQRLSEQHHAIVVSQKIPGIKTSAVFFASLRTNLSLNASTPPPSPLATPSSLAASTHSLPPPSPLAGPVEIAMEQTEDVAPSDPLAGVPELKTYVTDNDDEKIDALKLVADGVAQMRQQANNALIFHPLNLAVFVTFLALIARFLLARGYDNIAVTMTCIGVLFAALAGVRILSQGYLHRAESINWEWLGDADVIVTKFGNDLIGTAVVDWLSVDSKARRKKALQGEIRGWTVKMRYRKKGVGAALLDEAVKESKKKGAESLEFADDHASMSFPVHAFLVVELTDACRRLTSTPAQHLQQDT